MKRHKCKTHGTRYETSMKNVCNFQLVDFSIILPKGMVIDKITATKLSNKLYDTAEEILAPLFKD